MCGIVGAIAERDVAKILLAGLQRLEYRGYDSAGIAVIDYKGSLQRVRTQGKVSRLAQILNDAPLLGHVGIAHTRWATHGVPNEHNAHPHISMDSVAVVHNGIIENFQVLRDRLLSAGYQFTSDTDTEVIAHLFHQQFAKSGDNKQAAFAVANELEGAFALGIINQQVKDEIIAIRRGSPLVIGLGVGENYIASDQLALLQVTDKFIYLEEGDIALVRTNKITIYNIEGNKVDRPIVKAQQNYDVIDRGVYRHFMIKEIFAQPDAVQETLITRLSKEKVYERIFGEKAPGLFDRTDRVQIVACGTSYHAGLIARHWLEGLAGIPCQVEVASEIRYRKAVVERGTLFVTISQSGETADTLAALRMAKKLGYETTLAICNVAESSLVRESELAFMTRAGVEIGVASTKAFTTQLTGLLMLAIVLGRKRTIDAKREQQLIELLLQVPALISQVLSLDSQIEQLAKHFTDKQHALFLGRGIQYPIALEGALKLKEISYIHAEAYPAGELKHGPLALVDSNMPVIVVAPNDELLEKLKSNLQEVRARGGELFVFADEAAKLSNGEGVTILTLPTVNHIIAPIVYTVPLQLLAYHVAVLKGTDVDQPRNLAKSVTVE